MFNEKVEADLHLKLLANEPIEFLSIGKLRVPSIREIISIGESKYNEYLSILLFDKENLEDAGIIDEKLSTYELVISFVYHDEAFRRNFFNGLKIFFNKEINQHESGLVYFGEFSDEIYLDEDNLKLIQKILKIANFIEDEKKEEYEAGNERAKKFMEKLKKKKKNAVNTKQRINLHSLISSLSWKSSKGFDEILNLNMYQLYDGYRRLENMNNYHYTLTGIYTGNIDGKSVKMSEINWANIIKS